MLNKTLSIVREEQKQYKPDYYGNILCINYSQEQYRFNIIITSLLGMLGVALCIVEHEIYLTKGTTSNYDVRLAILIANAIVTALLIVSIVFNYLLWIAIERTHGRLLLIDSMPNNVKIMMAFEILLNVVMPYPFTIKLTFKEKIYTTTYFSDKRFDTVLITAMFMCRFYHLVRGTLAMSRFMNNRAHRICSIYGSKCSESFAFRSYFKSNSFLVSCVLYFIICICFGALFRFNNMPYKLEYNSLESFSWSNSMWCAFITMTTVGYGDFYPKSEFGRIVGVFCALSGAFIQSLFTVSFMNIFDFDKLQETSFCFLSYLDVKKNQKLQAISMITKLFKYK